MRMLVLDDSDHRHVQFDDFYADAHDVIHTLDPDEAIALLEDDTGFDMIWLDHDLANAPYSSPSDEKSGYAVAEWLRKNRWYQEQYQPIVVCHTMNHRGGCNMADALLEGGYTPILWPFTCLKGIY